jgi:hypothetical protein
VSRELDASHLIQTAAVLVRRIQERFPQSGLVTVASELHAVALEAAEFARWLGRPLYGLRVAVGCVVALLFGGVVWGFSFVPMEVRASGVTDVAQLMESGVNDVVFLGIAVFFLVGLEARIKRRKALGALHVLRSLAHIVDMHQLTKDPERLLTPERDTLSSPKRTMTPFQLTRYLDYCSEILALTGKLGALYVQDFDDADTVSAAASIEALTVGLSQKIWQKIVVLDRTATDFEAVGLGQTVV